LPANARREVGVQIEGRGIAVLRLASTARQESPRGRKIISNDVSVSIAGLDSLSRAASALASSSPGVASRIELSEGRKASSDAIASILATLSQVDTSLRNVTSATQRQLFRNVKKKLNKQLQQASSDVASDDGISSEESESSDRV
jgi:hypothetical protein